jgi:hypothetical protein
MSNKKKPIAIASTVLILILLAGGGYFAYTKLQAQTDKNTKDLATAGDVLVGDSFSTETEANPELEQPTFNKNLPPSRKIVNSLQQDNTKLSVEIIRLKETISQLNEEINVLEEYKEVNERFAPKRLKDEMVDIENQVKAFLLASEDAERFSVVQIEIMAAASALEYKEYVTRNRLMVTTAQRAKVAAEFLPGYSFCIGDGIALAANNTAEFNLVAAKFRGVENLFLPKNLKEDLASVVTPCQNTLRRQLDDDIEQSKAENLVRQ